MSTQIVKKENTEIESVNENLLKTFLLSTNTNLTEQETIQFYEIAKAYNLNPFKKEIYCIPYGEGDKRTLSIITGYEAYIKRAERTGLVDGWKVEFFGRFEKKWTRKELKGRNGPYVKDVEEIVELERCFSRITIHRKDQKMPFEHEVELCEYYQCNSMWNSKPVTMIKKVAIGQGFRLCFSIDMGGMPYLREELPEPPEEREAYVVETQPTPTATAEQAKQAIKYAKKEPDESARPAFKGVINDAGIRIGFERVIEVVTSHGYEDPDAVPPSKFRAITNALRELIEEAQDK